MAGHSHVAALNCKGGWELPVLLAEGKKRVLGVGGGDCLAFFTTAVLSKVIEATLVNRRRGLKWEMVNNAETPGTLL